MSGRYPCLFIWNDSRVQLSLCSDVCIQRLIKARAKAKATPPTVAFLCTPTDIHVCPAEVSTVEPIEQEDARWKGRHLRPRSLVDRERGVWYCERLTALTGVSPRPTCSAFRALAALRAEANRAARKNAAFCHPGYFAEKLVQVFTFGKKLVPNALEVFKRIGTVASYPLLGLAARAHSLILIDPAPGGFCDRGTKRNCDRGTKRNACAARYVQPVGGLYLCDGLSAAQGPNYALAKRMQYWRAMLAYVLRCSIRLFALLCCHPSLSSSCRRVGPKQT